MLRQRFKLPVDKMEFPAVTAGCPTRSSPTLTAVLSARAAPSRPWWGPTAGWRTAVGATPLARLAALLAFYHLYAVAANLLVFLLLMCERPPLIAGMVNKY